MQLIPTPRKFILKAGTCPADAPVEERRLPGVLPPQGFRLELTADKIRIDAADAPGAFYGRETLAQIRQQFAAPELPCLEAEDWPDFPDRGYMLDISRDKVPTMEHLFHLVDALTLLRYNQLQLYTEHTFAYPAHGTVWREASPMTADEIRALDVYCRERQIELVPNQNSFGHMERWLQHEAYHHLAECPDGFIHPISGPRPTGSVLKPNADSLHFLKGLYADLLPHFTSGKFNVGGDEPWELGQGWSRPAVEAEGKHGVYTRFLRQLFDLVEAEGRTPLFWADVLLEEPAFVEKLPASAIPILWGYSADHPFAEQARLLQGAGCHYYIAPGDSTWNSFGGRQVNMVGNVQAAAREGLAHGAAGLLLTHWGDNGHAQVWPVALPGLTAGGLCAWNGEKFDPKKLPALLNQLFFKAPTESFARVLIEHAAIDERIPVSLFNQSFLKASLRLPFSELQATLQDCPDSALHDCTQACSAWLEALAIEKLDCTDGDWVKEELMLAIQFNRFAARRCLTIKKGASKINALSVSLSQELKDLLLRYQTVWLRRNRLGGLGDSLARLFNERGE
jgi:hypothetical protein